MFQPCRPDDPLPALALCDERNARVCLLPGSTLNCTGCVSPPARSSSMRVNGNRRSTAALPASSSFLARAGWQGIKGCLFRSITKTRCIIFLPFRDSLTGRSPLDWTSEFSTLSCAKRPDVQSEGKVNLVNVSGRFHVEDTGLLPSSCLIPNRRVQSWLRHPEVPIHLPLTEPLFQGLDW